MESQDVIAERAKKTILSELNMTQKCLDEAVESIRIWLNLQPHLPHTIDSTVLRSFIIGCRSIDLAKEKLNEYFMARLSFPGELLDRNLETIDWNNVQPIGYLPDLTPDGCVVLLITLPDLTMMPEYSFSQFIKLILMMLEIIIRERPYITGHICLVDHANISLKFVSKISITHIINALYIFDHGYPIISKAIYNFNTPQLAHTLMTTLIRPIMSDQHYNSILSFKEDESVLEKYIPIEMLPQDYGGKAPSLKDISNEWRVKLQSYQDIFSGECALLPDKSKIPKQTSDGSNFGLSGSFRKLAID